MISFMRRLAANQAGASAVEFALVLPFLFLLHIGAAEALQAYVAQRNVSHIAATMADITSRGRTVSQAELNDILSASVSMMHPLPNVRLQQRITSMSASSSGSVTPDWTTSKDFTDSSAPSVPSGYLAANESAIVTDVIYDYKPMFGLLLPETIRFTRHAYVRPRLSTKVEMAS
jgi:Flp pilus assembly protein TadG